MNTKKGLNGVLADITNPLKVIAATGETLDFDPSNPAEAAFAEKFLNERANWRQTMTLQEAMAATPLRHSLPTIPAITPTAGATLKDALNQHFDEETRRGIVAKTISEKKAVFADFLAFFGDIEINEITRERIAMRNGWRETEYKAENGKYKDKKRSGVTLEKRRGSLSKFFEWARESGRYHRDNPMTQKMATKAEIEAKRESYSEFSGDDVKALFSAKYAQAMNKPDFYWLPLISLFSGARLGELARLELSTFEEVDGVKCCRVLDAKTTEGKRTLPIHSQLLKLGLWEYVEAQKNRGEIFFISHRPQDPAGTKKDARKEAPEKMAGRMWGKWVDACGIKDTRKVFHSFRSTAITDLHNANAGHAAIKRSVGHTGEGMTGAHSSYVRGIKLQTLQTAVELLKYPQVDFEALKLEDPTFSAFFAKLEADAKNPKAMAAAERKARHEKAKAEREERNRDKRRVVNV